MIFAGSVQCIAEIHQLDTVLFDPVLQPDVAQRRYVLRTADDKLLSAGSIHTLTQPVSIVVHISRMLGLRRDHVIGILQNTRAVFRIEQNRIVFLFHLRNRVGQ